MRAFLFSLLFVFCFFVPSRVHAQGLNGPTFLFQDTVLLLNTPYTDTAVAAGGQVTVDSTVSGDLVVAGGTVTVNGDVTQDVYVAGGTVVISGDVGGNIFAAGGEVRLAESSQVGGSFLAAGERVVSLGSVEKKVMLRAEKIELGGSIQGALSARGSVIEGQDRVQVLGEKEVTVTEPRASQSAQKRSQMFIIGFINDVFARAVIFLFFWYVFPQVLNKGTEIVTTHPFPTFLSGIAVSVLLPLSLFLLLFTSVAWLVGSVALISLFALALTGWVFLAQALGKRLLPRSKNWISGLVACVLFALIGSVPIIQMIASAVVGAWGVGIWVEVLRMLKVKSV